MEIPAGYAQANFLFTGTAAPSGAQVTMGFSVPAEQPTPAEMGAALLLGWEFQEQLSSSITLSGILVKYGPAITGPSAEIVANVPGLGNATAVPPNTSALVGKVTGFGGRAGRGRFYLPGLVEGNVTESGAIEAFYLSALQAVADSTFDNWVTAGYIPALLHGANSPIPQPLPVVGLEVSGRVATQRRRLRR